MKSTLFALVFTLLLPTGLLFAQDPDFYVGDESHKDAEKAIKWVKAISVTSPAYGSDIQGDTTIEFTAPDMTKIKVKCWQQPTDQDNGAAGHDAVVPTDIQLDTVSHPDGKASFVFPADKFPNGPINVRIYAKDDKDHQDVCELQLFNKGGVVWNQGIPKTDPPGADGMKLAFSDDFSAPLANRISHDGLNGATYQGHKTGGGDFSGWPFTSFEDANNPYSQVGTFLRIHASKPAGTKGSSGLLSSAHEDGGGFYASAPCYFECRFMAHSGYGTWPAFWLLTQGGLSHDDSVKKLGSDEYDVIEAYGGHGPGAANFANYAATSHYWGEKDDQGKEIKAEHDGMKDYKDIPMMEMGSKSSWSTTFHTYGIQIMPDKITYYLDDMPVLSHANRGLARTQALWFLINYAIGGISGWKIDLDRYNNSSDMWVDYVRVYQGTK